jgi:O-antigen/teichoic acid export membrane protein
MPDVHQSPSESAPAATGGATNGPSDRRVLLSGTAQNVAGLVIAGIALFVVQIITSRVLGPSGFGAVSVLTQAAFVVSFATRAGMDMVVVREVAIGFGGPGSERRVRAAVAYSAAIAGGVSVLVALVLLLIRGPLEEMLSLPRSVGAYALPAALVGLPFIALTSVWLGATRGLRIMRYTLFIFWAGQNLTWILFSLLLWAKWVTPDASVAAYSLSWAWAAAAAAWAWNRESRQWDRESPGPGWLGGVVRYAAPRAPAALFAQLLFWSDLFVVTRYVGNDAVGVYSAALRLSQIVGLFLVSVNLIFAPFVADLHARGERDHLDDLFKNLTRWIVASTLPIVLVVLFATDEALRLFGDDFSGGQTALVIVLLGQFVNAATGGGGLVLIMVGRTGWDLAVYGGSLVLNLSLAFALCPDHGIVGAAIANAVTFAASNAARLLLVRHFVGIQPYDRRYLRLGPAVVGGVVAAWVAHSLAPGEGLVSLAVTGIATTVVFGAGVVAFGLTSQERASLGRLARSLRAA